MKKYQYIPKRKKNTALLYQVSLANFFYFLDLVDNVVYVRVNLGYAVSLICNTINICSDQRKPSL